MGVLPKFRTADESYRGRLCLGFQKRGHKVIRTSAKVLVVISDTHIPDRVDCLHPHLIPRIKEINPDTILHAGDISHQSVLEELAQVAPVLAVRGNRDWGWNPPLPIEETLEINGNLLILVHGHGGWGHYFFDKADHTLRGYRLDRYNKYLTSRFPHAHGYIFGHSHFPENTRLDGRIYFNPGSTCLGGRWDLLPSFGVLKISAQGEIEAEIKPLEGYKISNKSWREIQ